MNRLTTTLENCSAEGRKALIPYLTAGDPSADKTADILLALADGGADVIELGVPFSDPMADGPVIQQACERALAGGMTLSKVLETVAEFRLSNTQTPIVLMGYLNPAEAMGYQAFAERAAAAGVDGVLLVDLTPEEAPDVTPTLLQHDLLPIFLAAPNTSDTRLGDIAREARGYLYYVSIKGVTGSAIADAQAVADRISHIKTHVELPVMVGFGISDGESARRLSRAADGVIIGSALIQALQAVAVDQAPQRAREFVADIRAALDAPAGDESKLGAAA